MKRIALISAIAISTIAGAASAQGTGDNARAEILRIAPNANVEALSNAQAVAIWNNVQDETSAFTAKQRAEAMVRSYQ